MDVEARIFEKLDKIEDRINELCIRLTTLTLKQQNCIF